MRLQNILNMNFFEELEWRGMLHDLTPGAKEALASGMCSGYIGFDPTAPSLTIGNYVQIMLLRLFIVLLLYFYLFVYLLLMMMTYHGLCTP